MRTMKLTAAIIAIVVSGLLVSTAYAGPVILGGDDLTDHGSVSGGVNQEGWLYIEKAVDSILNTPDNITRAGNDGSIAALGSEASTATSDDAGAAIGSAAQVLGKTVKYYNGADAINDFFAMLAAGTENPAMIWLAGTGAQNDLESDEGTALTENAGAIAAFVNSGGGLMAHGSGEDAYGWLTAAIPGLENVDGCDSDGATLTPAGQQAFPGLSNSDIDDNAGPCHSHFEGDLGSLLVLALDGSDPRVPYIIGGGAGTVISGSNPAPVMGGWAFGSLAGFLLLGGAWLAGRKARQS
jgi:hypothetical protein